MSEDRTQAPSKHRRQLAREQGLVAHSPELTAAAGWLGAVLALGAFRGDLARAMVGLVQGSMMEPSAMATDPAGVASRVRGLVIALSWPLGMILAAFATSAFVAHQMQVRGLWTASLIAPDLGRLWTPGRGPGLGARLGTVVWSVSKAVVIVLVSACVIYSGWGEIQRLSRLEVPEMARTAARSMLHMTEVLAGVLVVLGLMDYGLRYFRARSDVDDNVPGATRGPADDGRRCRGAGPTATDCARLAHRFGRPARRRQPRIDRPRSPDRCPVGRPSTQTRQDPHDGQRRGRQAFEEDRRGRGNHPGRCRLPGSPPGPTFRLVEPHPGRVHRRARRDLAAECLVLNHRPAFPVPAVFALDMHVDRRYRPAHTSQRSYFGAARSAEIAELRSGFENQ